MYIYSIYTALLRIEAHHICGSFESVIYSVLLPSCGGRVVSSLSTLKVSKPHVQTYGELFMELQVWMVFCCRKVKYVTHTLFVDLGVVTPPGVRTCTNLQNILAVVQREYKNVLELL